MRDLLQLGLDIPFHMRHLQRLPPQLDHRGNCILALLGPFKAIVLHDHAYVFNTERSAMRSAAHRLKGVLKARDMQLHHEGRGAPAAEEELVPFELVVTEHILSELCSTYQRRLNLFQPIVSRLLLGLTHGSESDALEGLHRLVPIKNGISNFQVIIEEAVDCLEMLLKEDENLVGLLLTERSERRARGESDAVETERHADVEVRTWWPRRLFFVLTVLSHCLLWSWFNL